MLDFFGPVEENRRPELGDLFEELFALGIEVFQLEFFAPNCGFV